MLWTNTMQHILFVLFLSIGLGSTRWVRQGKANAPKDTAFIGDATNDITTALFQGYIDDDKNLAFSPLGYSAILAILAEGAAGETRQQLETALHLPKDQSLIRNTFKSIMERLKNTNEYKFNQPELKNFFYIYKNNTINDNYKKVLEEYYLTDVRSIERHITTHSHELKPSYEQSDDDDDNGGEFTIEIPEKKSENKNEDIPELLPPKVSNEKFISFAVEDKPVKVDVSNTEYKPAKNIKEKIKLVKTNPVKDGSNDEDETMVAVEARNQVKNMRVLMEKNDISSSISVNTVGNKSNNRSVENSLMLIFNGMYFRGAWKQPFDKVEPGLFYKSDQEKIKVPMMKTKGVFKTGSFPELDSDALELPYDGGRYSLVLLVPRSRSGLARLSAELVDSSLSDILGRLRDEELSVLVPTFYVETTTKPVSALAKFGVSNIFSREAELTGVSSAEGLFVQELVQYVAVRVDNVSSTVSELSASNPGVEALKSVPVDITRPARRFNVEHPFIFYIVDRLDNLIVVAGKITDPKQPTPFEL